MQAILENILITLRAVPNDLAACFAVPTVGIAILAGVVLFVGSLRR